MAALEAVSPAVKGRLGQGKARRPRVGVGTRAARAKGRTERGVSCNSGDAHSERCTSLAGWLNVRAWAERKFVVESSRLTPHMLWRAPLCKQALGW